MARSATLLLVSFLLTAVSATFTPPPDNNLTACMRTINALPDPYDLGLPKEGNYIGPTHGMTILGDTCMIFCGASASLESSHPAPDPAVRPTSSATAADVTKKVTTIVSRSTSTSSSRRSSSTHSRSTVLRTKYMTKDVRPSETLYILGGNKPSTRWVVGGTHPTTLTTAPAAKRSAAPSPQPFVENENKKEFVNFEKRQTTSLPSIPAESAAVRLRAGMCLTLCPNAVLRASTTSTSATVTVTAIPRSSGEIEDGRLEEGGSNKSVVMTPAFIGLAIVLPVVSVLAVLGMGVALLKSWRRCKVLSNERNRTIEMPEGFYRMQK